MNYLLDTNVISQLTKERPSEHVVRWMDAQDENGLFLCVATLLDIRYGIELSAAGKKRQRLEQWLLQDLPDRFADRILSIERHSADLTGRILARSRREGWTMEPMDALIAATAMVHDMGLATMNQKHFSKLNLSLAVF